MIRHGLLVLAALGLLAAMVLGGREWHATSMPRIAKVADLPAGTDQEKLERFLSYGAFLPKGRIPDDVRYMPQVIEPGAPMLGWSFREFDLMALPFWAKQEMGYVLYREGANGYQVVPLDKDYLDLLAKETGGKHLEEGYIFPIWLYVWGWGIVLLVPAWIILQIRGERKRREAAGEM